MSRGVTQTIGDMLSDAWWRYELSRIPNAAPQRAVACLRLAAGDPVTPGCECEHCQAFTKLAKMWNTCPEGMPSRERFRTLLEVCFEQGWHSQGAVQ
jgi:hypothetical protein